VNEAAINGSEINSSGYDGSVSSIVVGVAYASGDVRVRGTFRSPVSLDALAQLSGFGRISKRDPITVNASAVAQVLTRTGRRDPVVFNASAVGTIKLTAFKSLVAQITHVDRIGRREPFTLTAIAITATTSRIGVRQPFVGYATAQGVVNLTANIQKQVTSSIVGFAFANGAVTVTAGRRAQSLFTNMAQITAIPRCARRSPEAINARAIGTVDGTVTFNGPYDEPAPPERTFIVPYRPNIFEVPPL
jgi:hypothetical protein